MISSSSAPTWQGAASSGVSCITERRPGLPTGWRGCDHPVRGREAGRHPVQAGEAIWREQDPKAVGELRMEVGRCSSTCPGSRRPPPGRSRQAPGLGPLDAKDLSFAVRNLKDRDAALRLVDTYFPGYREPFLGVRAPGPWLTCDEFFRSAVATGFTLIAGSWSVGLNSSRASGIRGEQRRRSSPCSLAVAASARADFSESLPWSASGKERPASASRRGTPNKPGGLRPLPPGEGLVVVVDDVPRARRSSASSMAYNDPGRTRRSSCRCAHSSRRALPPAWARPGFIRRSLRAGTWAICRMRRRGARRAGTRSHADPAWPGGSL